MKKPKTPEQWQKAVNIASVMVVIAEAQLFGLLTGKLKVDLGGCEKLLTEGKKLGYLPRAETLDGYIRAFARHAPPGMALPGR